MEQHVATPRQPLTKEESGNAWSARSRKSSEHKTQTRHRLWTMRAFKRFFVKLMASWAVDPWPQPPATWKTLRPSPQTTSYNWGPSHLSPQDFSKRRTFTLAEGGGRSNIWQTYSGTSGQESSKHVKSGPEPQEASSPDTSSCSRTTPYQETPGSSARSFSWCQTNTASSDVFA